MKRYELGFDSDRDTVIVEAASPREAGLIAVFNKLPIPTAFRELDPEDPRKTTHRKPV